MMAQDNQGFTNAQQSERDVIEGKTGSGIGNAGGNGATASPGAFRSDATSSATAQDVKQQASDMAKQATEQGKSMLEQQKGAAAGQVDSMAHAFRTTAEHLQGEGQQRTGDYVGMIADQLEMAARQLKEKNLDELLHGAQDLARRSPATFLAGSVAVGFLLARFLKSSQQGGEYRSADSGTYGGSYDSARRSQRGANGVRNMDSEDSTGMESGAGEYYRTEPAGYAEMSATSLADRPPFESTELDPDRNGARFTGKPASPLAGVAADGYSPAGTNAAGIAGAPGSAINPSTPSNPSTLGGNSYGNR